MKQGQPQPHILFYNKQLFFINDWMLSIALYYIVQIEQVVSFHTGTTS